MSSPLKTHSLYSILLAREDFSAAGLGIYSQLPHFSVSWPWHLMAILLSEGTLLSAIFWTGNILKFISVLFAVEIVACFSKFELFLNMRSMFLAVFFSLLI